MPLRIKVMVLNIEDRLHVGMFVDANIFTHIILLCDRTLLGYVLIVSVLWLRKVKTCLIFYRK